jgi:2,4-dienoyl-CoA reductase-like NADH-dependent reductase (Old Yellow Enzyme family)
MMSLMSGLFEPGRLGGVQVRNRIIRTATSESMASPTGEVTDDLVALYRTLAGNDVGAIFAGQMFCEERGRYGYAQTGIHSDKMMSGLTRLTDAVHRVDGVIFAQLAHAGNQSLTTDVALVSPSQVPNAMTGRPTRAASNDEIWTAVAAFTTAAQRAVEAGFDGIHIHGANGYLISSFMSPSSNSRNDEWGGTTAGRDRLPLEIVRHVRRVVPSDYPVTMKLGLVDEMGGLTLEESLPRAHRLVEAGLDAIEVSSNLATSYSFSARTYVGVTRADAVRDLLVHRVLSQPQPEAYFRPLAAQLASEVDTTVILTGGLRRRTTMESVLTAGDADFLGLGRPFIREPDLIHRLRANDNRPMACTSCNICAMHDEHHSLRCWRQPRRNLIQHAAIRLTGGLR